MNAQNERRNDPVNFGARITRFGVVTEKIWIFEVSGLFLREKKVVNSVHGSWTTSGLGPRWTTVLRQGARQRARQSSPYDHSNSPALGGDSWGGGVGHGVSPQGSPELRRR
jgi:hypothetical protein